MKTIKVIDLINKKINNEELPKKFKYEDECFVYDKEQEDYIYEYGNISFFHDYCSPIYNFIDCLATFNKEVEIIEEDKEIRLLPSYKYEDEVLKIDLARKIDELIKAVNSIKKGN